MKANIIKDNHAQGGVVSFFIGVMIAVIIALQVAWPVMDTSINSAQYASGTFTFSSNATCGDRINVTNAAGSVARFYINFTSGCVAAPPNYGHTNISFNDAAPTAITDAGTNLSSAFNNNATISGTMTATNGSAGIVILTYNTIGTPGNSVTLAESATNGSWSASAMAGGAYGITNMSDASETLVDQLPLFLVLVLLMVFVKALI